MPYKVNPTTGQLDYYEVAEGGGGGVATNLTFIPGVTSGTVTSDSGTDADIPLADSTNAGLFSAAEKIKLAGIAAGAEVNVNSDWNATSGDALILNKPTSLPSSFVKHAVKYGEALVKGQAAYVSSSDGTNMIVSKADYSLESTSSKTMGLIITSGATNFQGEILTEGLLAGTGAEPLSTISANAGDPVWLGDDGNLLFGLANKPVAPNHMVFIGIVTRVHAVNGEIFVKVQNGYELSELHDILITNPQDGQILMRDNDNLWKNTTPLFLTGGGNNGYLSKYINTYEQSNSELFESSGKIGLGTLSPLRKFHIKENAYALALEGTDHVYQEFYPQGVSAGRFGFIGYSQAGSGVLRIYNGTLGSDIDFVTDNQIRLVIKKAGQISINTIDAATTDTDKFLVSDSGEIKYRTGSQVLSDIGGQATITVTTTGTSGAATFDGSTLNIPQYTGGSGTSGFDYGQAYAMTTMTFL